MVPSHALLFFLLILTTSALTSTNADYTAPSPAPSPAHHHVHHGHHHHNHLQAPTPAPATSSYPPTHPPMNPPTPPLSHPPATPPTPSLPRKFVAVQGVVYCKNCTYPGVDTLLDAKPLQGAMVVLRCRNTKYLLRETATTDKNGYFFLKAPPLITNYGVKKCRTFLYLKPRHGGECGKPTNLNGGFTGAVLVLDHSQLHQSTNQSAALSDYFVYNVGPFAYEPINCNHP